MKSKSPEHRAAMAEASRKAWADPVKRANRIASMRKAGEEQRASGAARARSGSPEHREAMSEACRKAWVDPVKRANRIAAITEATRKRWGDPVKRAEIKAAMRAAGATRRGAKLARKTAEKLAAVEVPRWVPADLDAEYRRIAVADGEEAAAGHVRRLKAEARG